MRVEAVARLDALVEPLGGIAPLVGDHPALARAGGRARHGSPTRQRRLGLVRQGAKAHPRDIDGDIQIQRLFGPRPNDRPRLAFLAIAFDHKAGQRARQERQVVPMGDLLEQREAAHPIPTKLGLDVDVVDHPGGEHEGRSKSVGIAIERFLVGGCAVCHEGLQTVLERANPSDPKDQRISFFSFGSRLS